MPPLGPLKLKRRPGGLLGHKPGELICEHRQEPITLTQNGIQAQQFNKQPCVIHPVNYFSKSPSWTWEGKFPNRGIDGIKFSLLYEDREISTAFCWSSFGSRGSRSFSAVFSVDNTILYLIMLSGLANSQDRESVRSWVENSSNVWPEVFEWSQNWYPDTALSNLVHIRSKSYPHLRTNLNYRKSFNLQVRASLVPVSIFIRWDVTTLFLKGS